MKETITNALRKLGERSRNIIIKRNSDIAVVYVDHEYFGIWSFQKNTFVD